VVKIISVRFDFTSMVECVECEQDFPEFKPVFAVPFSCLLDDSRIIHGVAFSMDSNKQIVVEIDLSILSESEREQGFSETDRNLIIDSYLEQHIKAVN
jgi:hypothetical protein